MAHRVATRRNFMIIPINYGPPGPPGPYDKIMARMAIITGTAAYVEAVVRGKSTIIDSKIEDFPSAVVAGIAGAGVGYLFPVTFPCLLFYYAFR